MATMDTTVDTSDRMSFTFFIAIAVHALLIFGVGFTISHSHKVAPTLNITLATHQDQKPEQADFLAQQNQQASGISDKPKELTSKEDATFADPNIRDTTPIETHKTTKARELEQETLSTQGQSETKIAQVKDPNDEENLQERLAEDVDTPPETSEKAALIAKRDRLNQQDAMRPRIRRMTAVSAIASKDAEYLNRWNERVEAVGNRHFPAEALQKRQFGEMRIAVLLNPNGTIDSIEVLEASAFSVLNQAALQIVHLAAPFQEIPAEVLAGNDKLEIIRTWKFEINGLSTN